MFELTTETLILLLRLTFLAVLYLFLGLVLLVAVRRLHAAPDPDAAPATHAPARLVVLDSGSTSLAPGAALPLRPLTRLGRAPGNSIVLDATFVSAEHALIEQRDGRWWLTDRDSTNGTLLNDRPVRGQVPLAPGDVVGVGDVRLKLVAG